MWVALATFNGLSAKEDRIEFTINGKPVPGVVATVNGTDLSSDILYREMLAYRLMSAQQGRQFPKEEEDHIAQELLAKEIEKELFYQKARMTDILIPAEIVQKEIRNIENQFPSEELFLTALKMQNLTRGSLHEKIEKHMVAETYLRREIAPKVHVEEARAETYFRDHEKDFFQPQMYEVNHILISTIDATRQGKADNPQDQKKADRIIQGINEEARKTAETVNEKIKAGEDFAELAKKYSEDEESKNNGGALGTLLPHTTLPEIAAVMTKLKEGETSEVVQSAYGYHIVKLTGKVAGRQTSFAEVKADIMNLLLKNEMEKMKNALLEELKKSADIKIFI